MAPATVLGFDLAETRKVCINGAAMGAFFRFVFNVFSLAARFAENAESSAEESENNRRLCGQGENCVSRLCLPLLFSASSAKVSERCPSRGFPE